MKIVLMISLLIAVQGLLQINRIEENSGYTTIQLGKTEITNVTHTVLHIIRPAEILKIIHQIEENIEKIDVDNTEILRIEIKIIKAKIKTIIPSNLNRRKRGIINGVGSIYKWLFGLMDNDDKEEILEHLKYADINGHNAINTLNKQITINTHFNESIEIIKKAIENDRDKIDKTFEEVKRRNNEIVRRLLYTDQMLKLKSLENKITQIQENIASAKNNIIHPGVLTPEEIEKFDIDYFKLKLMKMGIMSYANDSLIIAIKIPIDFFITDLKLITPLPNNKYFEIDERNELIVTVNNITYTYEENLMFSDLKKSKNCIVTKDCKLKYNNATNIEVIDDDIILIKNAVNARLTQNCDNRDIVLNKNYFINFYNCELKILNENFVNRKTVVNEKFIYPTSDLTNVIFEEKIDFQKIKLNQFENIEQIKELVYHKNVSYGINITLILFIIIVIMLYVSYKKYCKNKNNENVNINIELETNPTTSHLKETVESRDKRAIWATN